MTNTEHLTTNIDGEGPLTADEAMDLLDALQRDAENFDKTDEAMADEEFRTLAAAIIRRARRPITVGDVTRAMKEDPRLKGCTINFESTGGGCMAISVHFPDELDVDGYRHLLITGEDVYTAAEFDSPIGACYQPADFFTIGEYRPDLPDGDISVAHTIDEIVGIAPMIDYAAARIAAWAPLAPTTTEETSP